MVIDKLTRALMLIFCLLISESALAASSRQRYLLDKIESAQPDATVESRMVQKKERVLSSCFTIVEIEHPSKAFSALDGISR